MIQTRQCLFWAQAYYGLKQSWNNPDLSPTENIKNKWNITKETLICWASETLYQARTWHFIFKNCSNWSPQFPKGDATTQITSPSPTAVHLCFGAFESCLNPASWHNTVFFYFQFILGLRDSHTITFIFYLHFTPHSFFGNRLKNPQTLTTLCQSKIIFWGG